MNFHLQVKIQKSDHTIYITSFDNMSTSLGDINKDLQDIIILRYNQFLRDLNEEVKNLGFESVSRTSPWSQLLDRS